MAKDNGGPAFPVVGENGPYGEGDFITVGMSLRDYFAAKAMQAMFNFPDYKDWSYFAISTHAYKLADAMLKASEE